MQFALTQSNWVKNQFLCQHKSDAVHCPQSSFSSDRCRMSLILLNSIEFNNHFSSFSIGII